MSFILGYHQQTNDTFAHKVFSSRWMKTDSLLPFQDDWEANHVCAFLPPVL